MLTPQTDSVNCLALVLCQSICIIVKCIFLVLFIACFYTIIPYLWWNKVVQSVLRNNLCQQSVEVLSKSVTFLDFQLSQGSVATYCSWGGSLCDIYIEKFPTNQLMKEFVKIGSHFSKLLSNIKGYTYFLRYRVYFHQWRHRSTGGPWTY